MLLLLQVLGGCFVPSVEASTFVEVELLEPSPARSSSVKYKTRPSLNPNYFHEYNSREFLFQKVPVRTHTQVYMFTCSFVGLVPQVNRIRMNMHSCSLRT